MTLGEFFYKLALNFGHKPDIPKQFPIQSVKIQITDKELGIIIQNTTGMGQVLFHHSDKYYNLVDINHLKNYLKFNPVDQRQYITESHDCDDFSFILQGDVTRWDSDLAFGIVWATTPRGVGHALNVCVGTDKKIYFVEPQSDQVFEPTDEWKTWWVLI